MAGAQLSKPRRRFFGPKKKIKLYPQIKYGIDTFKSIKFTKEEQVLMRIPRQLTATAILIIITVTVLPAIILFLLHPSLYYPLDVLFGFQFGLYVTLPSGIGLASAYLLAKGYFVRGQTILLTFGSAVLVWSWVSVAGIVFVFVASTLGPSWAVGSVGLLLSSVLHISGATPSLRGLSSRSSLKFRFVLAYASVTVVAALISYASLEGLAPLFFGAGGSTLLDKSFTLASIILFSASSILFYKKSQTNAKSLFQTWYSIGLAIFAVTLIPSLWGPSGIYAVGGLNALAVVVGSLCFFIAALVYLKENISIKK
jgi:hypothetical protein